ncbi:hypothetical protein Hanom_Chr13g01200811 [Helianthus anomalus]
MIICFFCFYLNLLPIEPEVSLEAASLFLRDRGKTVYILPSSDLTLAPIGGIY